MNVMKFDIYKGTESDMKESGGELQMAKCSRNNVKEYCKRQNIDSVKFFDGDYINGFWLEEAI